MLPRERVLAALAHQQPDRVPLDFWATPEVCEKLMEHFNTKDMEDVLQALNIDIREVAPDYIGPPDQRFADGSFITRYGLHRRPVSNQFSTYEEYASSPLAFAESAEDLDKFNWADPYAYDFEGFSKKIGDMHEKYYIKLSTNGLFEWAWGLRGYEQFMMDMILDPEIAHGIMERLCDWSIKFITACLEAAGDKIDMIYTFDDVAAQNSLLMSRDMYMEFINQYHVKLNAAIKRFGKTIMYHSCGAVRPLIDDILASGVDVLNPLQPAAAGMDPQEIKDQHGSKTCFFGAVCIQHLLPRATPEEVRAEVRRRIDILGKGGGYILASAHYIQADTPIENILAMYEEAIR